MRPPLSGPGFRRRSAAVISARDFGPNMTPMVDIVMVILIFFMAGSAFIGPEWFLSVGMARGAAEKSNQPPAEPPIDIPQATIVLRLSRDDGATVVTGLGLDKGSIAELDARLREYATTGAAGAAKLVLEPDRAAPYQDVIRVYDLSRRAGFASVGLARSRPAPPAPAPPAPAP